MANPAPSSCLTSVHIPIASGVEVPPGDSHPTDLGWEHMRAPVANSCGNILWLGLASQCPWEHQEDPSTDEGVSTSEPQQLTQPLNPDP